MSKFTSKPNCPFTGKSYNEKDLTNQIKEHMNFTSNVINSENLVEHTMIAHHLEIIGKGLFKLYNHIDEEVEREAKCSMIYLVMALDKILEIMKNYDSQIIQQKEELEGWKSLSSFRNDDLPITVNDKGDA